MKVDSRTRGWLRRLIDHKKKNSGLCHELGIKNIMRKKGFRFQQEKEIRMEELIVQQTRIKVARNNNQND